MNAMSVLNAGYAATGQLRCAWVFAFLLTLKSAAVLAADEDYVYKIVKGDSMIGLSARLLKSPADWPAVARHNRLPNPNYILPGADLRVPLDLLNNAPAKATVTHVVGDVKVSSDAGVPPAVMALGATLAEGAQVVTGKDGYVTLKLPDGSTVRVQSSAQIQLERLRTYPEAGLLESVMKLIAGRVESLVQKFRPEEATQTRHGVKTPLANLAVRGTEFRVTMDEQSNNTRSEVLDGAVAVAAAGTTTGGKRVSAGFGSVVDAAKAVSDPIALLAMPDVSRLAQLQERTLLRFALPAVDGARSYRAQVARDEAFDSVVAEIVSQSSELRVANIADGSYYLRVRAVDARGLEGRDALHAFKLKARPEPPLISLPAPKGKVRSTEVEFRWSENTEAAAYHLQVAKDAAFTALVHDDNALKGTQNVVAKLALGEYFWRVASQRKDGDHGPYSDIASFALLAPPALPEPPRIGANGIAFRWSGEPGQTFEFQMADNPRFENLILQQTLASPDIELPLPQSGTYFMRYRAVDPDGFVGSFIDPQKFSVPKSPYAAEFMPLHTP